jgi:glutamate--cysteine ligase
MSFYEQQLRQLSEHTSSSPLDGIIRGVEKENLRVDTQGRYLITPHPKTLGSPLTHPFITTDFSESLLECVTPPVTGRSSLFKSLQDIQAYVVQNLQSQNEPEFLWPYSMPYLQTQEEVNRVPLAYYGSSHAARMKRVYRQGLVSRYGNAMQLIAGIHYNISFPEHLLQQLGSLPDFPQESGQTLISDRYMGLIRNFIRYQWVLAYLFGASPSCFSASLRKRHIPSYLRKLPDRSFVGDYVCSLRLGDLGYHNSVQAGIQLGFDCVKKYAKDLLMATQVPDNHLLDSVVVDVEGHYHQLNRNLLQIENEYYFNIRPKSNPKMSQGERPAVALYNHGIEYIEFRGLDLDPLNPLGLSPETAAFCDLFLFYMLLMESPSLTNIDKTQGFCNLKTVVECGRHPQCKIMFRDKQTEIKSALAQIVEQMEPLAVWMDAADSSSENTYQKALNLQRDVAKGDALNLSGRLIACWQNSRLSWHDFLCEQQKIHTDFLSSYVLPEPLKNEWSLLVEKSFEDQKILESKNDISFEEYLENYFSQGLN